MGLSDNDKRKLQRMWNWFQKNETKTENSPPKLPRMIGKQIVKIGKASGAINYDSTGTVIIWRKNQTTGTLEAQETITGVVLDWMHGDQNISTGKEVLIMWFADEQVYRVVSAECE